MDEIQVTALCSLNSPLVCLFIYLLFETESLLKLAISTTLSGQPAPGAACPGTLDACCYGELFCGCQGPKLRCSCLCGELLTHWAVSPALKAADRLTCEVTILLFTAVEKRWREYFLALRGGWQPGGRAKCTVVGTEYLCVCASFLFSVHLSLFKPLTASSSETFSFFPTLLTPGLLFGGIILCV